MIYKTSRKLSCNAAVFCLNDSIQVRTEKKVAREWMSNMASEVKEKRVVGKFSRRRVGDNAIMELEIGVDSLMKVGRE